MNVFNSFVQKQKNHNKKIQNCKIKNPIVDEKKVKKDIKLKCLNGPEKLRLFRNINKVKPLLEYEKRKET